MTPGGTAPFPRSRGVLWALGGIGALYLAAALHRLDLPGLGYDEARNAAPALQILVAPERPYFESARAAGRWWPVSVNYYIGCLGGYLAAPWLKAFGVSAFSLRLFTALLGAAVAALHVYAAGLAGGARAALSAGVLLALSAQFIVMSRIGLWVPLIDLWLVQGALALALHRWRASGRPPWLYLACFCAGLGIYAHLILLWHAAAVAALLLLDRSRKLTPSLARGAGAAFLAGLVPFFLYNAPRGWPVLRLCWNYLRGPTYAGADNWAILSNLAVRLRQFPELATNALFGHQGGAMPLAQLLLLAAVLGTLALWAASACRADRGRGPLRPDTLPLARLLLALLGATLVGSVFTLSGHLHHHLYILWPLYATAAACLLCAAVRRDAVLAGLLAAYAACNLHGVWRYHRQLSALEVNAMSVANYALADHLLARGVRRPVALDWGIGYHVLFNTRGRVAPLERIGPDEPDPADRSSLAELLKDPGRVYLSVHEEYLDELGLRRRRNQGFEALAAGAGKIVVEEAVFRNRNGRPLYYARRYDSPAR